MKISYISEAVFKNPTQAKAARAKDASLSNVDKLASTVKNISNTKIKAEVDRIIPECLGNTSAFPFSSLFAQPIGGGKSWAFTRPVGNLAVNFVNDEEETFECIIDVGNMGDRYNTNDPVECIVGVFDPRVRGNYKGLTKTSSAEEIIEALTARSINIIKTRASKELKSKTLPASATYTRAALEKIIKYKFVIKNIFIGVNGALRVKNMMDSTTTVTVVPDEEVKKMLFSLITFIPRSSDACVKFKDTEVREIDSGIVFNSPHMEEAAKDIVSTVIRMGVEHTMYELDHEYAYIQSSDLPKTTNNNGILLKCKPAIKLIHKELLACLAKCKAITIKDIKYTYGRLAYTVTNLKTKAETEEIDTSKIYKRGISITYSLAGDNGDSYIFASASKDWWSNTWKVKNNSYFLANNLKPNPKIDELKFIRGTFWYEQNMEHLCYAKTVADTTNVFIDVYYRYKQHVAAAGYSISGNFVGSEISKLSNGKYPDITEEESGNAKGKLDYLLRVARESEKKKK